MKLLQAIQAPASRRLSGSTGLRLRRRCSPPQRGGVRGGEKQQALRLPLHPTPPATGVAGDPPRQGEGEAAHVAKTINEADSPFVSCEDRKLAIRENFNAMWSAV